jgi:predicted branched-subunit amino acid permease
MSCTPRRSFRSSVTQPRWFRLAGPYLLLDQVFALVSTHVAPTNWRAYYLGAGLFAWTYWQTFVGAGVVFGPAISADFDVSFAVPALFLALLVPGLVRRPAIVAASVGAVVTAAFWQVPNRGGMLSAGWPVCWPATWRVGGASDAWIAFRSQGLGTYLSRSLFILVVGDRPLPAEVERVSATSARRCSPRSRPRC